MFWKKNSQLDVYEPRIAVSNPMRPLKGNPGNPNAVDPKQQFITRAQNLTGKPLAGIENLPLDFAALQGMTDEEMNQLLDLVQRVAPEDPKSIRGGISNAMGNLGEIKETVNNLKDKYNIDTKALIDGILEEKEVGRIGSGLIRTAASVAGYYAGGGAVKLRVPKR